MDTDQNIDRSKMATTKRTNPKRQQTKTAITKIVVVKTATRHKSKR